MNIIAVLLFIIPGVIMQRVSYRMDIHNEENYSEFGQLINGILMSLPILFIVGWFMCKNENITTVVEFCSRFNDISFLIMYAIWTIIVAIILGILIGIYNDKVTGFINFIRIKIFKKEVEIDNESCWRKLFFNTGNTKYIEITIGNETHRGFVKCASLPTEEKEILFYTPPETKKYSFEEIDSHFTKIERIYVNIEKNIVIKDYDMSDYDAWCNGDNISCIESEN